MKKKKVNYNLQADTIRLEEFKVDDPADLEAELAGARLMWEKAYNAGNIGAATVLLNTIGKLSKTYEEIQVRRHEYMHRAAVMRLGATIAQAVLERFKALGIPQWENEMDLLHDKIGGIIEGTVNTEEEIEALT